MNSYRDALPLITICVSALIVIGLILAAVSYRQGSVGRVDAHVSLEHKSGGRFVPVSERDPPRGFIFEGEVAFTAERLREASALALAATIYAANGRLKNRAPQTVEALVEEMSIQQLIPPGLVPGSSHGSFISRRGSLHLRYRPEPLGIETISIGREQVDGPMLLIRIPDDRDGMYYRAITLEGAPVPLPFVSAAETIAYGWTREEFRGRPISNSSPASALPQQHVLPPQSVTAK